MPAASLRHKFTHRIFISALRHDGELMVERQPMDFFVERRRGLPVQGPAKVRFELRRVHVFIREPIVAPLRDVPLPWSLPRFIDRHAQRRGQNATGQRFDHARGSRFPRVFEIANRCMGVCFFARASRPSSPLASHTARRRLVSGGVGGLTHDI